MVDLRFEMDLILRQFGDAGLLLRSKKVLCGCTDSLSLAPDKYCARCLGTGFLLVAEKIFLRSKQSSSDETLPKNLVERSVGAVGVGVREFYTSYRIRPKQDDHILFCEWNKDIPIFNEYTTLYKILNVDPLKADKENGIARIEYFKLTSNSDPVNVKARFDRIVQNIDGNQYYVAVRSDL